jgi:hypothetical protein
MTMADQELCGVKQVELSPGGRGLKAPQGAWVPHVSVFETWGFSAPVLFRSGQGMKFIASSGVPRPE